MVGVCEKKGEETARRKKEREAVTPHRRAFFSFSFSFSFHFGLHTNDTAHGVCCVCDGGACGCGCGAVLSGTDGTALFCGGATAGVVSPRRKRPDASRCLLAAARCRVSNRYLCCGPCVVVYIPTCTRVFISKAFKNINRVGETQTAAMRVEPADPDCSPSMRSRASRRRRMRWNCAGFTNSGGAPVRARCSSSSRRTRRSTSARCLCAALALTRALCAPSCSSPMVFFLFCAPARARPARGGGRHSLTPASLCALHVKIHQKEKEREQKKKARVTRPAAATMQATP